MLTFTPLGTAIGFFPILDIFSLSVSRSEMFRKSTTGIFRISRVCALNHPISKNNHPMYEAAVLPDFAEYFAANAGLACLPAGHHALGRGENIDSQTAEDARDLGVA